MNFICQNNLYESLRSTKHFHLLVFHILADFERLCNFLTYSIERRNANDIVNIIKLRDSLSNVISSKLGTSGSELEKIFLSDKDEKINGLNDEEQAIEKIEKFATENSLGIEKFEPGLSLWRDDLSKDLNVENNNEVAISSDLTEELNIVNETSVAASAV